MTPQELRRVQTYYVFLEAHIRGPVKFLSRTHPSFVDIPPSNSNGNDEYIQDREPWNRRYT